ncbi:hypothetical protein O3Q52_01825 [Streptomyces sp. ActVer]|uniref:hypothetical protein n=1 Tax=Streptomyces sp. ActVer TaxID=3014558 RepID=UPI0022B34B71|nr:hypothetical protein [Streptomyces sp. ActVer]MCZ4506967.1 hypothetical protein [Streptomyces sp. ActVer]
MSQRPRKPWRVILTQNGTQLAEVEHTSEAKAFAHVRAALQAGSDTARVMQWEGGRWWHFETVTADEIPNA